MQAGLTVGNHIVPSSNENIDLGSVTNRFRELFLSGNTINLGGALIKRVAGNTVELPVGSNIGGKNIAATDQDLNTTDAVTFANITTSGYLRGPASFVIDPAAFGDDTGTVVIAGNLQVDGTTTTINSTTVAIDDLNFSIATDAADSAAANGAGISIGGAGATLNYTHATTSWDMNKPLNVTGDIGVSGTVDGVDIAARDAILTSTTTTAGAALPKAGGTMTGNVNLGDNIKANFGDSDDLQIYHDGTHSRIVDTGTGSLILQGDNLYLRNSAGTSTFAEGVGSVLTLYYGPGAPKLATTATGIDVTGTVVADGLTVAGTVHTSESQSNNVTKLLIDNTGGLPTAGNQQGGAVTFRSYLGDENMREAAEIRGVYLGISTDINKNRGGLVFRTHHPNGLADRMLIDEDGNVGIGTTSPEVKLEVNGGSDGSVVFAGRSDGGNGNNRRFNLIAYADGGGANYGGGLKIQTRSSTNVFADAITVQSNGNVGIGTTGPYFPLHVQGPTGFNGEAKNNGLLFDTASATTGTGGGLAFGGYSNGTGGDIYHFGNIQGIKENSTAGNYASAMLFSTRANGATPLEQMRISSAGNVGIGTTDPFSKLEVAGMADDAYTATAFNDKPAITIRHSNTSTTYGGIRFSNSVGNYEHFFGSVQTGTRADMVFQGYNAGSAAYQEHMRIKDTGNVGIGEASPNTKLDVDGPIKLNGSGNGQEIQFVKAEGGAFSTVTIELQFPGAGSYNYEVGVSGTSGCGIQFGGGYTNGVPNFSHTGNQQVGSAWSVTSPSSNLVRLVSPSGTVGTHPTAYVKARFGLTDGFDEGDVSIAFS